MGCALDVLCRSLFCANLHKTCYRLYIGRIMLYVFYIKILPQAVYVKRTTSYLSRKKRIVLFFKPDSRLRAMTGIYHAVIR